MKVSQSLTGRNSAYRQVGGSGQCLAGRAATVRLPIHCAPPVGKISFYAFHLGQQSVGVIGEYHAGICEADTATAGAVGGDRPVGPFRLHDAVEPFGLVVLPGERDWMSSRGAPATTLVSRCRPVGTTGMRVWRFGRPAAGSGRRGW